MADQLTPPDQQTVFVVDDDRMMCQMIRRFVESAGLRTEIFSGVQDFLSAYDDSRRGCLVADVWMPGMTGMDLQKALWDSGSRLPVILMSGQADVPLAVQALRAHAVDFLEKPFKKETLLHSIREALALDLERRGAGDHQADAQQRITALTPRQREVVDLVVAGCDNVAIARRLKMSVAMVETHRSRIMAMLGVRSLAELMRLTIDAGAVEAMTD
jgi:FixJ family two-component response regulator